MNELRVLDVSADCLEVEVVAALFFEDVRPLHGAAALFDWRLNGRISTMMLNGGASGRFGEHLLVANNGKLAADWILLIGGGRWFELDAAGCRNIFAHLLQVCCEAGFTRIGIGLTVANKAGEERLVKDLKAILQEYPEDRPECLLVFDEDEPMRQPLTGSRGE